MTTKKRRHFTVTLPPDLAEKVRDLAFSTPGATVSGVVEAALAAHVAKVEKKSPIPPRAGEVRTGRPIGYIPGGGR